MRHFLLAIASVPLCVGILAADVTPSLSLHGPGSIGVGSLFTLDVNISGVSDLTAFQFDVGFDPAFAQAIQVTEGPFLQSAGPTLFIPGAIDNGAGLISFTAGALAGMGPGASGAGVLARLQFTGLMEGTGNFTLLAPLLYDSIPNPIEVTLTNTSVRAEAQVPEPSAALLLAGCLAVLALIRLRAQDRVGNRGLKAFRA